MSKFFFAVFKLFRLQSKSLKARAAKKPWSLHTAALLLFFCASLFASCSLQQHQERQAEVHKWFEESGKIKILSTTAIVGDLVKRVGAEFIDSIVLIQGELDPHSYQLVKGDDEKLQRADLIFYSGLGLEHGQSLHHYLAENKKALALGDAVLQNNQELIITVNGQNDPHFWMDVSLFAKAVPFIVKKLSAQDPAHAKEFEVNGQKLIDEMEKTHAELIAIMHTVPSKQRFLVTSHDAFHYFARAYLSEPEEISSNFWKMRFAAPEGLAPESQLSATDIKTIIDHLKKYQIHLLFPESNVSRDSIRKILHAAKEKGMDVRIACCSLYGDALGPKGSEGETYLGMMRYNAKTLASHMND